MMRTVRFSQHREHSLSVSNLLKDSFQNDDAIEFDASTLWPENCEAFLLVANEHSEETVVAHAFCERDSATSVEMSFVCVSKEKRRAGLGKAVVRAAEEWVTTNQSEAQQIRLSCELSNVVFYEKCGYRVVRSWRDEKDVQMFEMSKLCDVIRANNDDER